jgi:two-component system LytT family response regulator
MIKLILIDDEKPALKEFEYLLKDNKLIEIVGMYTNPLKAIDEISELKPEVAFLDINMPQMKGIDAASKLLEICPNLDIVFVTAYDEYAIEAFELYAMDYLLKPISQKRFNITLERIIDKKNYEKETEGKVSNIIRDKKLRSLLGGIES